MALSMAFSHTFSHQIMYGIQYGKRSLAILTPYYCHTGPATENFYSGDAGLSNMTPANANSKVVMKSVIRVGLI